MPERSILICRGAQAFVGLISFLPLASKAMDLTFPAPAVQSFSRQEALSSYRLPTGPWADGTLPTQETEGSLTRTVWRLDAKDLTTLQILAPLRDQIAKQGFTILFQCETEACGGFDFRYATDILPEPEMHVDLGDFRFLAATRTGTSGPEAISLTVSRSTEAGFVQMIAVGPADSAPDLPLETNTPVTPSLSNPSDFVQMLKAGGSVALDDLAFETGSANLGAGDFPSLDALAGFLKDNPTQTVALVGHTDASGGLAGNTSLSKARATSVRDRLVQQFSIPPGQVAAEGVGYLAPRATNLTEGGRARNRRVEVVLTSIAGNP